MTTYAVLIYGDESEVLSESDTKAQHEAYAAYSDMLAKAEAVTGGEQLHPGSTATTIRVRDGKTLTTDGPFMESKEVLGGFYLITAADLDGAISLAAQCPGAASGAVEVRPVVDYAQQG